MVSRAGTVENSVQQSVAFQPNSHLHRLVGGPVCSWQNSRNYPTIYVLAGSARDLANSLHPLKALISAIPARPKAATRTMIVSAYDPGTHQTSN